MTNTFKSFASDNYAGVHPRIIDALTHAYQAHTPAYGNDPYTKEALDILKSHFGNDIDVYFVFNGTGANMLALNAVVESYQSILCAETAHINTDECGAIEKITSARLVPIKTPDGKLTKELLLPYLRGFNDAHRAQPRVISISQASEYGTIYRPEEISMLSQLAHSHNMLLHVDGSRLSNAAAKLNVSLRTLSADVGIDVLSFGGTKNGMMFGEAVLFFNKTLSTRAKYLQKQNGQLASKQRFIAAQFTEILRDNLWRSNAQNANEMAELLARGLSNLPHVSITQPVECNVVFAKLPKEAIHALKQDYAFYVWDELTNEVRWMTAFDTTKEHVDDFLQAIKRHVG